jgi:hypothetical protein
MNCEHPRLTLTAEQRRLFRVLDAPWLRKKGDPKLPTYDEWDRAHDALFGTTEVKPTGEGK